jgi:HSP20 family protein
MRREMDHLLGDAWERAGYGPRREPGFSPKVDVYYCGEPPAAIVKVDLAGVDAEGVSLEISGRELVISGERKVRDVEGRIYQQVEIPTGAFRRHVELSSDVVAEEATATYDDGILRVELPLRDEAEATRTVPIERTDD